MALLSRPAEATRFLSRVTASVRPGKVANELPSGEQNVFEVATPRWEGSMRVGPLDRSEAAEAVLSWVRRWTEDAGMWTTVPLFEITAGDPPAALTVASISAGKVITASADHNLNKGEGVRIDGLFGVVVTVPSDRTFRLYPEAVTDNAGNGDGITGTDEVLAKAVQPAEVPLVPRRGIYTALTFDWIEKSP